MESCGNETPDYWPLVRREKKLSCLIVSSRSSDLANSDLANLICHMNYSIIFTEISFFPETSSFSKIDFACIVRAMYCFVCY